MLFVEGLAPMPASADDLRYTVTTSGRTAQEELFYRSLFSQWTLLTVRRAKVVPGNGRYADLEMPCSDFLVRATALAGQLN